MNEKFLIKVVFVFIRMVKILTCTISSWRNEYCVSCMLHWSGI